MHPIKSSRQSFCSRPQASSAAHFESLEERQLLSATAPTVTTIAADNRGQAIVYFNQAINTRTLSTTSVREYTAGADGVFGTRDDTPLRLSFSYSRGALTITGGVRADTRYRIFLADTILGTDGVALNGTGGRRGGNFDVTTTTTTLTAQFSTIAGVMHVTLVNNATLKPTLSNFLYYADHGLWDGTFIQRNGAYDAAPLGPLPIIQGGQYAIKSNTVTTIPTTTAISEVTGLSNTLGTIAMARTSSLTNSETDQWFFNTANDTSLDAGQYTAFGTVASRDLGILAKLAAYPAEEAGSDLPVVNPSAIASRGGTLDPNVDLVIISRVAMLMNIEQTSAASATAVRAVPSGATSDVAAPLVERANSAVAFSNTAVSSSIFAGDGDVLG